MTNAELDELQKLCDTATPSTQMPWSFNSIWDTGKFAFEDALFIAAAREALPKLIAEVRELVGLLETERLGQECQGCVEWWGEVKRLQQKLDEKHLQAMQYLKELGR